MKRAALGAAWVVAIILEILVSSLAVVFEFLADSIHDHIVEPIDAARNRLDK